MHSAKLKLSLRLPLPKNKENGCPYQISFVCNNIFPGFAQSVEMQINLITLDMLVN